MPEAKSVDKQGKFSQVATLFKQTARDDKWFLPIVLGTFLVSLGVLMGLAFLLDHPILLGIPAVLFSLLATLAIAGRRASAAAFGGIEGQAGAAAAVLMSMRGHWHVTPVVSMTRNQDCVHRVVGRPGVILVAEGSPSRAKELLGAEARKLRRVIGETPLYDVLVGDGDGKVALRKLQMHLMKLPRNIKPKEVNDLEARLKAMGGSGVPIPKGPIPGMGANIKRPPRNMR